MCVCVCVCVIFLLSVSQVLGIGPEGGEIDTRKMAWRSVSVHFLKNATGIQ